MQNSVSVTHFGTSSEELLELPKPLVRYGLSGLRRCWMPEFGRWSYKYHLDGRTDPNECRPSVDLYYSLNVLLGLSRVRADLREDAWDVEAIFRQICVALPRERVRNGAWGMALWAAAELGLAAPAGIADRLRPYARDISPLVAWTAQDVGLSLSGAVAQARDDASWRPLARGLRDLLMSRFRGPLSLFRDSGQGPRRHFATFATQVYAALSLYQYGEWAGDESASAAADDCVRTLLRLQGDLGEWPWFYMPQSDRVLDLYEVYSVHQHGMGPALVHEADRRGVPGARAAIKKGFEWVFGQNELGCSMLVPDLSLIYRSQARRGVSSSRSARALRAARNVLGGDGARPAGSKALQLTREMRSYEFGWLLWSFGDRSDYPEFTYRSEFIAPQ